MKRYNMYILIFLSILQSFLLVFSTVCAKFLIDEAVKKGDKIYFWIIICILLLLSQIFIRLIISIIRNKYYLYLENNLKKEIFKDMLNKNYLDILNIHSGKMSNIYLSDISVIASTYSNNIPQLFLFISRFFFAFIALIFLRYEVLLVLLIIGLILFFFSRLYSKKYKSLQKKSTETDDELNSFMQETFTNSRYIKAMNSYDGINKKLDSLILKSYNAKTKRNMFSLIASNGINIIANLCYTLTMCFAAYLIYIGEITYGSLTALVSVVSYFESPFQGLSIIINKILAFKVSKSRIEDLKGLEKEEISNNKLDFNKITFKNVEFGYTKPIFKDFNYEIKKGDLIIIKGKSGAGKTTLFNLLLGLIKPNAGKILVDDEIISSTKRNLFSLVPQENILFSGTLRENICMFNNDLTDEEILKYLRLVNLDLSLDYVLKERGQGLSIGQIQRILILIALLKDSPILLMDEFTSALDFENEKNIVDIIKKIDKTIIIVSHKELNLAGRVLLLDGKNN